MSISLRPRESQHTRPPVHHQLPEFTQTYVHQVGDAIQPSHSLSSPSPPAPNPSQHQGLFQWVNSLHEVAKVLEFQFQHQSFQCILIYNKVHIFKAYSVISWHMSMPWNNHCDHDSEHIYLSLKQEYKIRSILTTSIQHHTKTALSISGV